MDFASLKLYRLKYKLPQPLSMATYTWTHVETILVQLRYKHFIGMGEAAPFALMTGETYDYVVSQLQKFKDCPIKPHEAPQVFYQFLQENIHSVHAAAALDAAFHDLLGLMQNKPVYELFGQVKKLTPNSLTIPVLDLEATQEFAMDILQNHPQVQLIKIKLNNDQMNPEIIRGIKEIFAKKHVAYVIDPNQGFKDSGQAIDALKEIQAILGTVVAIEQPVEKHNYQGLYDIKNQFSGVDIYADESIVGMDDLEHLIRMKAVTGINIKIQKAGGIWQARLMAQRAQEAGLKVMVGCMMESPLGIAAGIHFAISTPNVAFTDLDSDLFLYHNFKEPIFTQSPYLQGMRMPFNKPGLGIEIHENVLKRLAQQQALTYEEL